MPTYVYSLPGSKSYLDALYPDPELINPATREKLGLKTSADVIAHFTATSLQLDGIQAGLMAATLGRDAQGELIRKAGVMAVVVAGGEVRPGDPIAVELPPEPHQPLRPV